MIVLLVIHLLVTLALIGVILLQKSEGGGLGMGGGNSQNSLFTARGAANLLTRLTAILATIFIALCLVMTIISKNQIRSTSSILQSSTSK